MGRFQRGWRLYHCGAWVVFLLKCEPPTSPCMLEGRGNVDCLYKSKRLNLCTKSSVSLGSRAMSWLLMLAVAGLNRSPSMSNSTVVLESEISGNRAAIIFVRICCELRFTVLVSCLGGSVSTLRVASGICDLRHWWNPGER